MAGEGWPRTTTLPSFFAAATVSSQSFCQFAVCACAKHVDANNSKAANQPDRIMDISPQPLDGQCFSGNPDPSVTDVLQEQAGGNLVAEPLPLGFLIDLAADGVELRALQITAFRIGDLGLRGA